MNWLIVVLVVAAVTVPFGVARVSAFQCPMLINRIDVETRNRFDLAAHDARKKLSEAAKLHAEGKHREAEMIAKAGFVRLGIKD
jgi:hypothetical protein